MRSASCCFGCDGSDFARRVPSYGFFAGHHLDLSRSVCLSLLAGCLATRNVDISQLSFLKDGTQISDM